MTLYEKIVYIVDTPEFTNARVKREAVEALHKWASESPDNRKELLAILYDIAPVYNLLTGVYSPDSEEYENAVLSNKRIGLDCKKWREFERLKYQWKPYTAPLRLTEEQLVAYRALADAGLPVPDEVRELL